jgi:L-ascorbate metabolism protein UlaG (beta-lactamase superfamily)
MVTYTGADLIRQMNGLSVQPDCLAIWGLGQMGVALKGADGAIVYVDPCLSNIIAERSPAAKAEKFARAFPPPLQPHEITNAAYVLCTHEHLDHTDPLTLGLLTAASPEACFVISGWAQHRLDEAGIDPARRIVPPDEELLQLGDLRLTAVPSAHYTLEHDSARGHRWLGFVIEWNGVTLYHSGDTIVYDGYLNRLRRAPRADVAIVAANGRDSYRDAWGVIGNLLPAEVAWLSRELGWDVVIAGHNDLFEWNSINVGQLPDALRRANPRQKLHTLQPGELYYYVR